MKKTAWPVLLMIVLLAGGTALGVWRLMVLRFQAGDVYPPYSSLRADPLGVEVLYDALGALPGMAASRNFQRLDEVGQGAGKTLFVAGASPGFWDPGLGEALQKLAGDGARVVVTLQPVIEEPKVLRSAGRPAAAKPSPAKKRDEDDEENGVEEPVDLRDVAKGWFFSTSYLARADNLQARSNAGQLEPAISWHSLLCFTKLSNAWRVVYQCQNQPVMIERRFGKGSMVIASDSYFLSNEAMRRERAPKLLAWLAGSPGSIIFDERHLGVTEDPGIATLMRKYRLGGLLAAILGLAALFIWQTAAPLLPPPEQAEQGVVAGRDSAVGFISLLRRGIAPADLIAVCVEQWKKSFAHNASGSNPVLQRVQAAAAERGGDPAAAYRSISKILAEKS